MLVFWICKSSTHSIKSTLNIVRTVEQCVIATRGLINIERLFYAVHSESFKNYLLACHTCNTNAGNLQPDNEVAKSLAYKYNNRITSHFPTNISSVYTTTLLLSFNKNF